MNGTKYPRQLERINSEMSMLKMPFGWVVIVHSHVIVGGKDTHVSTHPLFYDDPDYEWQLEAEK